ncbi:MAG: polymer-forming cytoskeletal protein [Myxococcota bacterium]
MPRPPRDVPLSAVMGPDAHHSGDLSFEGRVRIDGTFTGRLYSEDVLELGPTGVIEGEVDVARAIIAGRVEGTLRVREHLQLTATARVFGALDAGVVEMQPGATLNGNVRVAGGELP